MVFESIVVRLLDKYLGDYIQNLDAEKLKIDLWHGKISIILYIPMYPFCIPLGNVTLENVYLKPDALVNLLR